MYVDNFDNDSYTFIVEIYNHLKTYKNNNVDGLV